MKEIENLGAVGTAESAPTSQPTLISVCQPELTIVAPTANPTVPDEFHDRAGRGPGEHRTQLGKKRPSRNAKTDGEVSNITQVKGETRQNWPSIVENLIAAAEDEHVQAFSMVLEEGFGVAPWTLPETMSLAEMARRGDGYEVAPTWAIESMRRCPNCGETRCVHMVCARCAKCDTCATAAGSAQELNR
jgi:hypothetical protein